MGQMKNRSNPYALATPSLTPGMDVIILAGGRGERMGGRDKATVSVDGERLIDMLLDEVSLLDSLMSVVVVTTRGISVRSGVRVIGEEPPFSGEVAAIAAGVAALGPRPSSRTAILAVTSPQSAARLPDLEAALDASRRGGERAGVAYAEGAPLCAVWEAEPLRERLGAYDSVNYQPIASLYEGVASVTVEATGEETGYDTLDALSALGEVGDEAADQPEGAAN